MNSVFEIPPIGKLPLTQPLRVKGLYSRVRCCIYKLFTSMATFVRKIYD